MVIFHSYVSLPEGNKSQHGPYKMWFFSAEPYLTTPKKEVSPAKMAQKHHGFSGKIQTRHPDPSASSELVLSLECQNPIEFPGNIKIVCVFACSSRFMYACVYIIMHVYYERRT